MSKPDDYKMPERGFLVVCMALGKHITVAPNLEALARVIGAIHDEAVKKWPNDFTPIQCFELGRELAVSLEYRVRDIYPKQEGK